MSYGHVEIEFKPVALLILFGITAILVFFSLVFLHGMGVI